MQCANCGKVNQRDPQLCPSCGHSLSLISPVHVRVSSVAIAATIFGPAGIMGFVAAGSGFLLAFRVGLATYVVAGLAIVLPAITAIAKIRAGGGRSTGAAFTLSRFLTPVLSKDAESAASPPKSIIHVTDRLGGTPKK